MGKTLVREMAKWLKMRGYFPYEERVFITKQGYPLNKRGVERIFTKIPK